MRCEGFQIDNGFFFVTEQATPDGNYKYQTELAAMCLPGFRIEGAAQVTCQADGTWDADIPTCVG